MLKKITLLCALISLCSHIHAAQPRPAVPAVAVNANLNVSNIPHVPLTLELNVSPNTLVSGLGFAGCLAALQLYKEGAKLTACQDIDPIVKKAKLDEGNALINRSYVLFAASAAAIFNKQILSIFIKQG
ncbi:MAG: hypothetical protein P4L31_06970 [Candidatus Babeliales bacterium]|nr:hypothetical protein [Candidatus Babeliales bacterium]